MRKGIEGVGFDLDGTLYPNYRLHYKLIPFVVKELRLLAAFGKAREVIRNEQENDLSNLQGDFYGYQAGVVARLLKVPEGPLKDKIDLLIYKGWEPLFKNVKLCKGAKELLYTLKKEGFKLGVLSDFPVKTKLEHLGISEVWDAQLCTEHCGAVKPHPLSFAKLAEAMGLPPEKILYVGNSHSYDIIGAARAGMKTALIKSPLYPGWRFKNPKPDFIFSDYRQLHDFVLNYSQ